MKYEDIEEIAIICGKKDLILEFLENFHIDRQHDGAPLNTILIKRELT